mmetsp:Transcript_19191/g.61437  ORF Transcript_19191/g.61437 Transcript_19191/m.61437 type:complete len:328 (-) Transcript_19191:692-1675(-)
MVEEDLHAQANMSDAESQAAAALVQWRAARGEDGGPQRLPLQFASEAEEINFLALRALLDFGRGHAAVLQDTNQRSLDDVVLFGLMHMHISGKKLNAQWMVDANAFGITQHFDLKGVTAEKEVMGGVFQTVDGPLMPYVKQVLEVLHQTGQRLQIVSFDSLGDYVLDRLTSSAPSLPQLVADLAARFPAFRDVALDASQDGSKFALHRKAVLLARSLSEAFAARDSCSFKAALIGLDQLPPAIDSALVSALIRANLMAIQPDECRLNVTADEDTVKEHKLRLRAMRAAEGLRTAVEGDAPSLREVEEFLRATYSGEALLTVDNTIHY